MMTRVSVLFTEGHYSGREEKAKHGTLILVSLSARKEVCISYDMVGTGRRGGIF
jgi:hypothetical protein